MKRVISILLALVMTLSLCSAAWAIETAVGATGPTEGTCGAETNEGGRDSVKWKLTKNGGKVAERDNAGNETGVMLPAYTLTISGKGEIMSNSGTEEGNNWFTKAGGDFAPQVTSVIIGEGITGIGRYLTARMDMYTISLPVSLKSCDRLGGGVTNITVAEGNTDFKVQGNALLTVDGKTLIKFFSEDWVENYAIPNGVTTLREHSFSYAPIAHITIPNSVTSIEMYAFQNAKLEELVIPDSVTSLGESAVAYECPELRRLVIGDGITKTVSGQFRSNPKLEEVVFGKGIQEIANMTFSYCSALKTVTFSEDCVITKFGGFSNCPSLERIEIPSSVKKIDTNAFAGDTNLREVIMNEGLEEIKYWVFKGTAVDSITIPSTVKEVYGQEHGFLKVTLSTNLLVVPVAGVGIKGTGIGMREAADGFSCHGWFDENGGWLMSGGGMARKELTEKTTAYAVYKTECAFEANGGTGDVPPITSYVAPALQDTQVIAKLMNSYNNGVNNANQIPNATPTREGYTFTGWNTAADGSGDSYQVGHYLQTTNQPITKLYAQWGREVNGVVYTVSCNPLVYNGEKQTPTVTVKADGETLSADQYTVTPAEDGINAGIYTGTVTLTNVVTGDEATGNAAIDPAPVVVDDAAAAADANVAADADEDTNANADAEVDANVDTEVENETENDVPAKAEGENGDAAPALKPSMSSAPVTLDNGAAGTPVVMANNVTIDFKYEIKKVPSALQIDAPATAKGNSTVTLIVSGAVAPTVTCSDTSIEIVNNGDGTYSAAVPDSNKIYTFTVTNAGDANHEGGTKSVTVKVTMRSSSTLTLEKSTLTAKKGETQTIAYTYHGDGKVTAESSDPSVATVTMDENAKTITVKLLKKGTADIVVRAAGTVDYKSATAVLVLTVEADAEDNNNGNDDNNNNNNNNNNGGHVNRRYPSKTNTANGTDTANTGKNVKSGDTGDMGIALYAAAALLSATGMAWFGKKRGQ